MSAVGLTEEEVDRLASRPLEEMNDGERAYFEALRHLIAGRRPDDPGDARRWERRRLCVDPSVVARQAGFRREPIAAEKARYGWIWRLAKREEGKVVEPVAGVGDVGERGLAASNVALRSIQAGVIAERDEALVKARLYDQLVQGQVSLTTRRRGGGRAGRSNLTRLQLPAR